MKKQFETENEWRYTSWFDETLGFGAKRVKLNMGLGYTTIYIDFLLFRDQIIHYDLGADISEERCPEHCDRIIQVWRENGGPTFVRNGGELIHKKDFSNVWLSYESEVAKQLGPLKRINVPEKLKSAYALLTDPFENSRISMVACDKGKPAIDVLEDARRIDLIENVLRGQNPGGRIYAAISLLRKQKRGVKLKRATRDAIRKIVNLDADAETCWGQTGIFGLKARDIVPEYVKSKDWYLLRR